jgi:hypothetical protein
MRAQIAEAATRAVTVSATGTPPASPSSTPTCQANGTWSVNLNFTNIPDQAITITAAHSNVNSVQANQASVTITKDATIPTVTISSPTALSYINNANKDSFTVSGSCSENGSTVSISSGSLSATPSCSSLLFTTTLNFSGVADGPVTISATHQDVAGNSATQNSVTLTKDTVVDAPANLSTAVWYNSTINSPWISWNSITDSGSNVARYEVSVASSTGTTVAGWTSTATDTSKQFLGLSLTEGTKYYASARAVDNAGNTSSVTAQSGSGGWTVDVTGPTAPGNINNAATTTDPTQSPLVSWSASTDTGGSGVSYYQIAIGTGTSENNASDVSGSWQTVSGGSSANSATVTSLVLSGGIYYANVRAVDIAGNLSVSAAGPGWTVPWTGTKQFGLSGRSVVARDIKTDPSGNIYISGDGISGSSNYFVKKYSSGGSVQWTGEVSDASSTNSGKVGVDSTGNVYLIYKNYQYDVTTPFTYPVIKKYNPSGGLESTWSYTTGLCSSDCINGTNYNAIPNAVVTAYSTGNIYLAGETTGNFNGSASTGSYNLFVMKVNSSGARQWVATLGVSYTMAKGVAIDSSENVYVAGDTSENLDGNTITRGQDMFLVKYNSSGTKQWTKLLGGGGIAYVYTYGVAVDSSGNIFVTGRTTGASGADIGGAVHSDADYDLFLVKYDPQGTRQWTKLLGGAGSTSRHTEAYSVSVDSSDNIFVAGYTTATSLNSITKTGNTDAFLIKYNTSGTAQWTKLLGVSPTDTWANGVATDSNGNIFITGPTRGGLDGNSPIGGGTNFDAFVTKYNPAGTKQ